MLFGRSLRNFNSGFFANDILIKESLTENLVARAKRSKQVGIWLFILAILGYICLIIGIYLTIFGIGDSFNVNYYYLDGYLQESESGFSTTAIIGFIILGIAVLSYIIYFILLITFIVLALRWRSLWKKVSLDGNFLRKYVSIIMTQKHVQYASKEEYKGELFNISMSVKKESRYYGMVAGIFILGLFSYGWFIWGSIIAFVSRMNKYIDIYKTSQIVDKIADEDKIMQNYQPIGNSNNNQESYSLPNSHQSGTSNDYNNGDNQDNPWA